MILILCIDQFSIREKTCFSFDVFVRKFPTKGIRKLVGVL